VLGLELGLGRLLLVVGRLRSLLDRSGCRVWRRTTRSFDGQRRIMVCPGFSTKPPVLSSTRAIDLGDVTPMNACRTVLICRRVPATNSALSVRELARGFYDCDVANSRVDGGIKI